MKISKNEIISISHISHYTNSYNIKAPSYGSFYVWIFKPKQNTTYSTFVLSVVQLHYIKYLGICQEFFKKINEI